MSSLKKRASGRLKLPKIGRLSTDNPIDLLALKFAQEYHDVAVKLGGNASFEEHYGVVFDFLKAYPKAYANYLQLEKAAGRSRQLRGKPSRAKAGRLLQIHPHKE